MLGAFLPRPAEGEVGVERVPWYHRNADYDEIGFFHGGDFLGFPLPAGRITHSPQGLHHGAPEIARVHARDSHEAIDEVKWQIVFVDTRRPLRPNPDVFTP
jgi:homogentisate 1,2-dioxygenase